MALCRRTRLQLLGTSEKTTVPGGRDNAGGCGVGNDLGSSKEWIIIRWRDGRQCGRAGGPEGASYGMPRTGIAGGGTERADSGVAEATSDGETPSTGDGSASCSCPPCGASTRWTSETGV